MPANDDGFVGPIPIQTTFHFFNKTYSSLSVLTNGMISFDDRIQIENYPTSYRSESFIAGVYPFWSDVDTTNGRGNIFYREVIDDQQLSDIDNDVQLSFQQFFNFRATWAFIATWHQVLILYIQFSGEKIDCIRFWGKHEGCKTCLVVRYLQDTIASLFHFKFHDSHFLQITLFHSM